MARSSKKQQGMKGLKAAEARIAREQADAEPRRAEKLSQRRARREARARRAARKQKGANAVTWIMIGFVSLAGVALLGMFAFGAWSMWDTLPIASVIFALPVIVTPVLIFYLLRRGGAEGWRSREGRGHRSVHIHNTFISSSGGADYDDGDD